MSTSPTLASRFGSKIAYDSQEKGYKMNMGLLSGNGRQPSLLYRTWTQALLIFSCILFLTLLHQISINKHSEPVSQRGLAMVQTPPIGQVLVSYSYFEKDSVQLGNMEFFLAVGLGMGSHGKNFKPPSNTDCVIVISGEHCSPCKQLYDVLDQEEKLIKESPALSGAWVGKGLSVLKRVENEGMDFAAHNATIEWVRKSGDYSKYKYFIFLNSSVKGPFYPSYMPEGWQWTMAYTDKLVGDVKAVSSSVVCLPPEDLGGFGPKLESWAFSVEPEGLELLVDAGVFHTRLCKLCGDGVVVMGEYGLSNVLLGKGYNIATLMSRYGKDIDWRDEKHWHCNNNVHPSRHGTYDGISMHPFETVFLKASWHVGEPFVSHYSAWFKSLAEGQDTTAGSFDEPMYRYAITMQAQEPNNAAECYKVQLQ